MTRLHSTFSKISVPYYSALSVRDTDLSEMSVHLLGIHAVLLADTTLSICYRSVKGESYHCTVHMISHYQEPDISTHIL